MSYQERRAIAALVSTMLVTVIYLRDVFQRAQVEGGDPAFWGRAILLFIPVSVLVRVIVQVVFIMINTMVTQQEEPDITDERDWLIGLKITRNFMIAFIGGFFLAMGLIAAGQPLVVMFTTLMLAIVIAGSILDLSEFYYYRRGV